MKRNEKQNASGQATGAIAPTPTLERGQPTKKQVSLDGHYPGLNGLSWAIGYMEQFLAIISEPLLVLCASLAVIDFITGGQLLKLPLLNYLWASALAVSVTACFIVMWRKSIRAFTLNRYGAGIGLAIIGVLLGVVDFSAIAVQTAQQTLNISFEQSLQLLNLNVVLITYLRSGVTIAMAVIVALSNHSAVTQAKAPARRLKLIDQWLDKVAPVIGSDQPGPAQNAPAQNAGDQKVIKSAAQISGDQNVSEQKLSGQVIKASEQKTPTRLHVVTSLDHLDSIERRMYDAVIKSNDREQLLKMSQEQDLITFTDTLKSRYSPYASYITPERVAHILSVATAQNESTPAMERVKNALEQQPTASNRELSRITGLAPGTCKKYRGLLAAQNASDQIAM